MRDSEKDLIKKQIQRIVEELDSVLKKLQDRHMRAAMRIGYTRDAVKRTGIFLVADVDQRGNDEEVPEYVSRTVEFFGTLQDEVSAYYNVADQSENYTSSLFASATGALSSAAAISGYGVGLPVQFPGQPLVGSIEYDQEVAENLRKLSPAAGDTYLEAAETLYGTTADPERVAMFAARQTFDSLLDTIAPDDEVRKSPYWQEKTCKESEDINAVWRSERIRYAISKYVNDDARSRTLLSQADQLLAVYKELNKAHKRRPLNESACRDIILSMMLFLSELAKG